MADGGWRMADGGTASFDIAILMSARDMGSIRQQLQIGYVAEMVQIARYQE